MEKQPLQHIDFLTAHNLPDPLPHLRNTIAQVAAVMKKLDGRVQASRICTVRLGRAAVIMGKVVDEYTALVESNGKTQMDVKAVVHGWQERSKMEMGEAQRDHGRKKACCEAVRRYDGRVIEVVKSHPSQLNSSCLVNLPLGE